MYIISALALLMLTGLIFAPEVSILGAFDGMKLCAEIIIPSLFPFFVCTKLLCESGFVKHIGKYLSPLMRPVFNVPGCGGVAFILGILGGYPLGAKCAADMYSKNMCTKAEAERIICFCNNSGPAFIIGSVGVGMLCSKQAGLLLYIIHLLSALTLGFLMRFYKREEKIYTITEKCEISNRKNSGFLFSEAVKDSVLTIIFVCGFIIFFSVFLALAENFKITEAIISFLTSIGLSYDFSKALCFGFFELTSGAYATVALPYMPLKIVVASILLAWSGLSVILQTSGIISKSGLSTSVFVIAKVLHGVIAVFFACILCRIPVASAVFSDGYESFASLWVGGILNFAFALLIILSISFLPALFKGFIKIKRQLLKIIEIHTLQKL